MNDISGNLTDRFYNLLHTADTDPETIEGLAKEVQEASDSPERDGLLALMYYEGIGVEEDLEKSFEYAEKGAFAVPKDALSCFILGRMCENAETPDQADGGPRQEYDHYDAERFFEYCFGIDSPWKRDAALWLGAYYMNFARGGDPEVGVEYYESIASEDIEAAEALSDYYWNLAVPDHTDDAEWIAGLYRWTSTAYSLAPDDNAFRMGCIHADGLGCRQDMEKALEFFEEAWRAGDWQGADAIARIHEQHLLENPALPEKERHQLQEMIDKWDAIADEMYAESLTDPEKEGDAAQEED